MLRIDSTNTNYNASCVVNNETIANFNAGVNNPDSGVYVNLNLQNLNILADNATVIKADLDDFIDYVIGD